MKTSSKTEPRAFALVVSLTMLVLLTIVAVGLLGLSAITLRTTSQTAAMAEAQANARMALMIAIGELQEALGPDQRVSARAEILDTNPDTPEVEGVAHPHYLGVWDSWDTWLTDNRGPLSIQDTYGVPGRHPSLFRRWLVSHPDAGNLEAARSGTPGPDPVVMLGEGGAGPDPSKHVNAARVPVRDGVRHTGNHAWWISDESQKARIDLAPRDETSSAIDAQILATHTGRMGIEMMEHMEDFDTRRESLPKMISTRQAGISAERAFEHFHDITAHSRGLFTDVRFGGFKSDLNLAFESDTVPEKMGGASLFGGREFEAPVRPMEGALSSIRPANDYIGPVSWRRMREFYRIYRDGFPDSDIMTPATWTRGNPVTRRFIMGRAQGAAGGPWRERDTAGYARDLVMLRQSWIIATQTRSNPDAPDGRDYFVLAIPVITLWNPYNVTLRLDASEVSYLGAMYWSVAMRQRTYRGNTLIRDTSFPDVESWPSRNDSNHNLTANQYGYRMITTESGGGSQIEFQPGEVRIFSTDAEIVRQTSGDASTDAMYNRFFFASPEYIPVQDDGRNPLSGLKYEVFPGTDNLDESLNMSLYLAPTGRHNDNIYYGSSTTSALVWNFQEVLVAQHGARFENGGIVSRQETGEWHDVARTGATVIDWVRENELPNAWIIGDSPAERARWGEPGSPPLPVGIFSIVAKSPEIMDFHGTNSQFGADFRNRTWLHALPTRISTFLMNPQDLNRATSAYQVHFRPVNSDQEVAAYLEAEGRNGFFGGGYTRFAGQTHVVAHTIPTSPATSIATFAGMRMDPGRTMRSTTREYESLKHLGHAAGACGVGIGNGYAHPMVGGGEVYRRHDFGIDRGFGGNAQQATNLPVTDDYWDHLFLANEELWDSWFCSGIAPAVANGRVTQSKRQVAEDFFSGRHTHVAAHFEPDTRGMMPGQIASIAEMTNQNHGENGWERIAAYIFNKGQFNVNSTSKDAWKALLMSMSDRPVVVNEPVGGVRVSGRDASAVTLSRYPMANSAGDANGPLDGDAWRGIRKLNEAEIDRLAEEIVRQVKIRGPFLNMSEFINRRLTPDATGVTGALQAAIDWDEFNAGFNGTLSGSGPSINAAYKTGDDMIRPNRTISSYPNSLAATGSRFAGIPGYVMQSDILQGISSSLTVRGDTFLIRAYGESLAPDGGIVARAWCEAVVQRMPEYLDPSDPADVKIRTPGMLSGAEPPLGETNRRFGRKFEITTFRWLNPDEV